MKGRAVRRAFAFPIVLYRRFLSPLKPPTCRFHPTCSAYAHQAILAHGIVKGTLLAGWRVLRCQPFCEGGYDPVPGPGAWRSPRGAEPPAPPRSPAPEDEST